MLRALEREIEQSIIELLRWRGWYVLKTDAGMAARYGGRGTLPRGAPDLIAIKQNQCVLLEVKTPKGKLSPEQIREHHIIALNHGTRVHTVRSVDDVIAVLEMQEAP